MVACRTCKSKEIQLYTYEGNPCGVSWCLMRHIEIFLIVWHAGDVVHKYVGKNLWCISTWFEFQLYTDEENRSGVWGQSWHFLLPKITNGLMDTDVVFRKLVGHNLCRSITCFLWWFHDYGPNSSESAQYVLEKWNMTELSVWLMSENFFKSNESMEVSCQVLS